MKQGLKSGKLTKVKSNPLLRRDESIKQLHLESLNKPKSLMVVHYKEKRLSIPIFDECINGQAFLTKNLIRFEQQVLRCKSLDHFRSLLGYRTKDRDVLKDYYFVTGRDISIFKLLELQPIWKPPNQPKGLNNFEFQHCLHNGKATKVYLTRHKLSGKFHALKLIRKDRILSSNSYKLQMIKNQENALKVVSHQFIVKLQDAFETAKYVVFVMQYCHGGSLKQYLKTHQFSEHQTKFYMIQLLMALQKVHEMRFIHQDIQPSSILIDSEGHLKLSGFGNSLYKLLNKSGYKQQTKLHQSNQKQDQGYMMDYYSVGALCYQLLTGMFPQDKQNLRFPKGSDLSQEAQSFVKQLLDSNPNSRLGSLGGVKEIFSHSWLRNANLQRFVLKVECPPISVNMFAFQYNQEYDLRNQLELFEREYQSQPQILSINMDSQQDVMKPIRKSPIKEMSRSKHMQKSKQKHRESNGKVVSRTSNKKITINIEISKKKEIKTALQNNLAKIRSQGQLLKNKIKRL